ncbi:MAG TPA: fumarate hydratase [Clostridia bacterium]|nr:fumarate hydratase [Clostridia bacterium]
MRVLDATVIEQAVYDLVLKASYHIGSDVCAALESAQMTEESPAGLDVLKQLLENNAIASRDQTPICQDTGMMVLFAEIGQDVHIVGNGLEQAVEQGVRRACKDGYLRKSVVSDPLFDRRNTGDNTPAVLHARIMPGEQISLLMVPKGFGSENMSQIRMFPPSAGEAGVRDFIVEVVRQAGPNPCPPVIVGVGVGGTFEQCALMAKRMTARPVGSHHPDPRYAALEAECLRRINALGIGPAGLGGRTTALAVNIEDAPTHIAGMPVAVNICCHAARHAQIIL